MSKTHLCENGWTKGSIYDCPKHDRPKKRPVVRGANTMTGKEVKNG